MDSYADLKSFSTGKDHLSWTKSVKTCRGSHGILIKNELILAMSNAELYAINKESGKTIWKF